MSLALWFYCLCLSYLAHAIHDTIWQTVPWTSEIGNISCDESKDHCIIHCIEPSSCSAPLNSTINDEIVPYIICPTNGKTCLINCIGDQSCSNNVIISGNCEFVEINVQKQSTQDSIIHAPNNGDLIVNLISEDAMFQNNLIVSHQTNNIILNCNGYESANNLSCYANTINAISVTNSLNVSCTNSANCNEMDIYCPSNDDSIVSCNVNCNTNADCQSIDIYANDLDHTIVHWSCDNNDNDLCQDSMLFCNYEYSSFCEWQYIMQSSFQWSCEGTCNMNGNVQTSYLFDTTTISNNQSNDTNTIVTVLDDDNQPFDVSIEVVGYILLGCAIGGIMFCIGICVCLTYIVLRKQPVSGCESSKNRQRATNNIGNTKNQRKKSHSSMTLSSAVMDVFNSVAALSPRAALSYANGRTISHVQLKTASMTAEDFKEQNIDFDKINKKKQFRINKMKQNMVLNEQNDNDDNNDNNKEKQIELTTPSSGTTGSYFKELERNTNASTPIMNTNALINTSHLSMSGETSSGALDIPSIPSSTRNLCHTPQPTFVHPITNTSTPFGRSMSHTVTNTNNTNINNYRPQAMSMSIPHTRHGTFVVHFNKLHKSHPQQQMDKRTRSEMAISRIPNLGLNPISQNTENSDDSQNTGMNTVRYHGSAGPKSVRNMVSNNNQYMQYNDYNPRSPMIYNK